MTADQLIASAVSALQSGDRDGAARALAELLGTGEDLGGRWLSVAKMAMAIGEVDAGAEALDRLVQAAPGEDVRFARASMLAEAGRTRRALELAEAMAAAGNTKDPRLDHLVGTLRSQLGDFEGARRSLDNALAVWPLSGPTWLALAALVDFAGEPAQLDRLMAQRADMDEASPAARAAFLYALGKAHDDVGEAEHAFRAFAEGAAIVSAERSYDRKAAESQVAAIVAGWDASSLASLAGDPGADTSRPILVTGIARSGTTLVEQLLVRHEAVGDGTEAGLMPHLLRLVGGAIAEAARRYVSAAGSAQAAWARAAGLYLHLLGQRLPAPGRLVDKSLNNTRFLGLIRLALPDAPLVWVRRDPLDTAWSCFRTYFVKGLNWSWDLEDIAHHIRLEERLLAHWRQVLGDRLLVVDYEQLIADPEGQGRRLLAHCGLPDQSLAGFETSDRAVATSSVAQVRRPIYSSSIGAAEPYRKWLEPFVRAYGTDIPSPLMGEG